MELYGHQHFPIGGSVAEWSKALVLGTSLSGRGFESHRCQDTLLHSVPTVMWVKPLSMLDKCGKVGRVV